tara:strand:+ start:801 stop:1022 length:222 start_codon:yes stop_codon:yes gene_type:complete
MNSVINEEDKIWKTFLDYVSLVDNEAINFSIDMYGTEHKTTIALGLTQAYYTDRIVTQLTDIVKQSIKHNKNT